MGTGYENQRGSGGVNKAPADMTPEEFSRSTVPALDFMIKLAKGHNLERLVTALIDAREIAKRIN